MNREEQKLHDELLGTLLEAVRTVGDYVIAEEIEGIILNWVNEHSVKLCCEEKIGDKDLATEMSSQQKPTLNPQDFSDLGLSALAKSLQMVNKATDASKPLSMEKMKLYEKLPKERIERYPDIERKFGIKEMKCSVSRGERFDWDCHTENLLVRGELSGRLPKDILLLVMIFNGQGEMIEYNQIPIYHGEKSESFSEDISIPKDETISKVIIRPIYRPTELVKTGIWATYFAHD